MFRFYEFKLSVNEFCLYGRSRGNGCKYLVIEIYEIG